MSRIVCLWVTFLGLVVVSTFTVLLPNNADAAVKVKSKKTYYNVRGKNGKALNDNMLKEGRKVITLSHAIAATRYDFDFSEPKIGFKNKKCIVKHVDVTLNVEYIFPKWVNRKSASPAMRKHWANFWKELQRHEAQHGRIAKEGAKALEKEILSFKGNKRFGCKDMGRFASFKLSRIMRKTRTKQRQFDRREYSNSSKISKLQQKLYDTE